MKHADSFLLALFALFAVCPAAYAESGTSEETSRETDPMAFFTAEAVRAHAGFLASPDLEGRCTGEKGCRKAAEYIRDHFRKIGLKPFEGEEYFQKYTIDLPGSPSPENRFELKAREKTYKLSVSKDFVPFGFSSDGEAEGEVVFAGYGITSGESGYDDYAGVDVKGRIVLVMRHGPGSSGKEGPFAGGRGLHHQGLAAKAALAKKNGAAAMMLFSDPLSSPGGFDELDGAHADGGEAGIPCIHVKRRVAAAMLALCRLSPQDVQKKIDVGMTPQSFAIPDLRVKVKTVSSKTSRETENVGGIIEGSDPAIGGEAVIIGAHYDHIGRGYFGSRSPSERGKVHPGADDNASGTAGVMLLAEAFASLPYRPRRTMLFIAFSGEEMGLFGSQHYVQHPRFPLAKTAAMINLDMLGYLRDKKIFVMCAASSPGFKGLIAEMSAGLPLSPVVLDGGGGSDQDSFKAAGVPVLFFCTGMNPNYHSPRDTIENMSPEGEAEILRLVYLTAARISASDEKPVFASGGGGGHIPGAGPDRPVLGIFPDSEFKGKGVRILQVSRQGPARKAGLVAGDVIVQIGEHAIGGQDDLSKALDKIEPGSKMKVKILRSGRELELEVEFKS